MPQVDAKETSSRNQVATAPRFQVEEPGDARAAGKLLSSMMKVMRMCWQPYQEKVGITFQPNWDQMLSMLVDGSMLIITARSADEIVGFQMWTINAYYYSMGTKIATLHRILGGRKQGLNARAFLEFGLSMMKQRGARTAMFGAPAGSAAAQLFQHFGATQLDVLYGLDLWPQSPQQQSQ